MAIAYFSTWTTYGTWLPGDDRGWFESQCGLRDPDLSRKLGAKLIMTESAVLLEARQRELVEATIRRYCTIRNWPLHAVNCRTNHVHVVVGAADRTIEVPREQFKAWCTRKLREQARIGPDADRQHWWTERGWDIYIDELEMLANVVHYVNEGQTR